MKEGGRQRLSSLATHRVAFAGSKAKLALGVLLVSIILCVSAGGALYFESKHGGGGHEVKGLAVEGSPFLDVFRTSFMLESARVNGTCWTERR